MHAGSDAPAENTYDQYAEQYARMIDEREPGTFSPYHDLVVPCLLERVGDVAGLTVLDAGCGHGHVARILHRTMEEVITAFVEAGFYMRHYSDVGQKGDQASVRLASYYRLPFFTLLEFVRT